MEMASSDETFDISSWREALEQIIMLQDERVHLLKRDGLIQETLKKKDEQLYSERMINKFKEKMYSLIDEKLSNCQIDEAIKAKIVIFHFYLRLGLPRKRIR